MEPMSLLEFKARVLAQLKMREDPETDMEVRDVETLQILGPDPTLVPMGARLVVRRMRIRDNVDMVVDNA